MTQIEALPCGILFWRSLTHWLGGMGIILLTVALLPAFGRGAFQLYKAEVPGLTAERLQPRVIETAKILWTVYVFLSLAETALLFAGGMPFYDALCHTFGTMATGGFSTKASSIGYYGAYTQWIIIFFKTIIVPICAFVSIIQKKKRQKKLIKLTYCRKIKRRKIMQVTKRS